ncbi:lytic transglycosylase domain-containing protein [Gammaproteobacteria bacterium]|nr:lytic transglycosylase domain-containing protein [Gammaproteobacteria bacterium]
MTSAVLLISGLQIATAETIRVYETPEGTRLITSRLISTPDHTLIREYEVAPRPRRSSPVIDYRSLRPVPSVYDDEIGRVATEHGLEKALLKAVVHVESAFRETARSPKGAVGLMQLMPQTAKRYGVVDSGNPSQNLQGGARYLRDLLQRYEGDKPLALAAYNAGEGAVEKYGNRIPPYAETQHYVVKVMYLRRQYLSRFD